MRKGDALIRIVVLASGNGSNLQVLLDQSAGGKLDADVVAVFSDVADAHALARARDAGVPAHFVNPGDHSGRRKYDEELSRGIGDYEPDLIVLAGFMRILSPEFVERWRERVMNIHPSLLPAHKGLNTHQRVLDAGDPVHGATVHFVTPELDGGPIIVQEQFDVRAGETVPELERRVHEIEYRIYPLAIQLYASGRLSIECGAVLLDGAKSEAPRSRR